MRIKIEEPSSYIYQTVYQISVTDLNYGNHLSNEKLLSIAHEARMRFLSTKGWTEMDMDGVSLIQGDAAIVYHSEGFYADEVLVEIAITDVQRVSFDIIYKMYNQSQKKDLATVKTGMVCFDYDERKVKSVPASIKALGQ